MKRISLILMGIMILRTVFAIEADFIVSKDGVADFTTVQEAINAVPDFRKERTTIYIKNGIYKEKLILPASKIRVTLIGENVEETILTNDDYASKKNVFGEEMGTTGSSSFFVFGDELIAENITFKNSSGPVGQAVAVRVDGDQVAFKNCRFLGFQDTLYPHGKSSHQYYYQCTIEGTVDFIFGWSTALFEDCNIICKKAGYITAPSTEAGTEYGFVFKNCTIDGDAQKASFYLGRPWRPYAKSVFINCSLSDIIKPEGWHNWNKTNAEKTCYFAEFNNTGKGARLNKRVEWSHQLTENNLDKYKAERILGIWVSELRDNWIK